MRFAGRRALLLGLGRFGGGVAAARYLLREGADVRIADRCGPQTLRTSMDRVGESSRVEWCLGREDVSLLRGVDLVVANPAVAEDNPLLRESVERGVEVTQEVNLFLDAYPGTVVLVTGTNGKSSTATLVAAGLRAGDVSVLLGGNIGNSLLEAEARRQWRTRQVAVVEISSFQLERVSLEQHRVVGTVLTRITEDHLDRHGSIAAYRAAKARAAYLADGFVVHCANDRVAQAMGNERAERVTYTLDVPAPGRVGMREGWLWSELGNDPGPILHPDALLLQGNFQIENVLAATAAAQMLGVSRQEAANGMCHVRPLPGRLQQVGVCEGVRIYDNSVSTQLESTFSALENIEGPVHWVGGGKSKGGDIRRLLGTMSHHATSAHLFGSVAPGLEAMLRARMPTTVHIELEEALGAALQQARPGEAILFSPGFSSHDQFVNYAARAQRFRAWVEAWMERRRPGRVSLEAAED